MKIGVALSGGGVLAVAHMSLLEQLEAKRIKPSVIAGTSAGSIIGALFVDGGTKRIKEFLTVLEKDGLFSRTSVVKYPTPERVFDKITKTLDSVLTAKNIEDLGIKFICNATNMANGEMELFEKGPIVQAVMASSSVPGVFPLQEIGGKFYCDGGMSRNILAKTLKNKSCDFVIGSSLYTLADLNNFDPKAGLRTRAEYAIRGINILQKNLALHELEYCDFRYTPPLESFQWYNFDKMAKVMEIGREYAQEKIGEIVKAIKKKDYKGFWANLFD